MPEIATCLVHTWEKFGLGEIWLAATHTSGQKLQLHTVCLLSRLLPACLRLSCCLLPLVLHVLCLVSPFDLPHLLPQVLLLTHEPCYTAACCCVFAAATLYTRILESHVLLCSCKAVLRGASHC